MKNVWITAVVAMFLLVAGCGEKQQVAVWGMSSPNQDLNTMVGLKQGDIEAGFVAKYGAADNVEWNKLTPDWVGGYVTVFLTQDATITDTHAPSPLGPMLESLHARPYLRFEVVGPLRGDQRKFQPNYAGGSLFTIDPDGNIGVAVEYLDGDGVETGGVYIGGVLRF